jgi:uncharacterized membrane protein YdjX (TVP38/TMEM64 family)
MKRIPWKLIILVVGIGLLLWAVAYFDVKTKLDIFNVWVADQGITGIAIFIGVYIVATVLFFPCSILTLGAGVAFGLVNGCIAVSIGSTIGASCAFLVSRYLARDAILKMTANYPSFNAVDRAIGDGGGKIVGLLRLSPALPYNMSNYFYGLTAVKFTPYVLASWIGMLPGTVMYVYIGYIAKTASEEDGSAGEKVFKAVGLVVTIIVTIMITKKAKASIAKYSVEPEPEADDPIDPENPYAGPSSAMNK